MLKTNYVPFSCCSVSAIDRCDPSSDNTVNRGGCAAVISSSLYDTVLSVLGMMSIGLAFCEVRALILLKIILGKGNVMQHRYKV